jgi:hypothetical protein
MSFNRRSRSSIALRERCRDAGILAYQDYMDPQSGNLIVRTFQDVEPILKSNAELRVHGGDGYSPSRELRRVASIPLVVCHRWLKEEGLEVWNPKHADRLKKKLNDPENLLLRTAPGRL